jgi:hypothetical protein
VGIAAVRDAGIAAVCGWRLNNVADTPPNRLRRPCKVFFIDGHTMRVNCGRCGKEVLVRIQDSDSHSRRRRMQAG